MTAPARVDSAIVRKIIDHYAMIDTDIAALNQQITQQLIGVYKATVQSQLNLYGCQKLVTGPDNAASRWIDDKATKDSEGIARTFNRELANKVNALRAANPRGNRFYYMSALDDWMQARSGYKTSSIALNAMTQAREYAQTRFIEENKIGGKFVLVGPPPVCKICLRIKALGAVTFETTKKRRLPAHANCPHRWGALIAKKISCDDMTWTG